CLGGAGDLAGGLLVGFGTDGVDGTSGAAGAMIDEEIMDRAAALGLDLAGALASNDSATYFARAEAQIVTGPTGTNVADLAFYFR
ncbi:MAG: glycerate kinase, partial [Deltaproteobacteria bacterium]|nr:glycerate kinase [Deltaproteobacteria bacterium]